MSEKEIISFTLQQGHLLRLANNLAGKATLLYTLMLRPDRIAFDIRSGDKKRYLTFPIDGGVILYEWDEKVPPGERNIDINLNAETMKATLKSIKKNTPTTVKIFAGSHGGFHEQKSYGIYFCGAGGTEGFRNIRAERAHSRTILAVLPTNKRNFVTVLGAKTLGNKLVSFADNRDIEIYVFPTSLFIRGELKAKAGVSTEVIGDPGDDQERAFEILKKHEDAPERMIVSGFIQPLRALCALYDGPVHIHHCVSGDNRQLVFINHVSYYGCATMYIRPKDLPVGA
jgi:hypothetical protein